MYNIQDAQNCYNKQTGEFTTSLNKVFNKYAPAYIISNEDLRHAMQRLNTRDANVLSVAASGDQPIFFNMFGARNVDTFDISYCARAITDIKANAIKKLSQPEYINLLTQIGKNSDLHKCNEFNKISSLCHPDTIQFINQMHGRKIFRPTNVATYSFYTPLPSEYKQMQNTTQNTYKFIWTDLESLHTHLNTGYDIIYLSNIIQYNCNTGIITETLTNLRPFTRPHAQIVLDISAYFTYDENLVFRHVADAIKPWGDMRIIRDHVQEICIINCK